MHGVFEMIDILSWSETLCINDNVHSKPHIHVKNPLSRNISTRLRMYKYCYSNLGAIYARIKIPEIKSNGKNPRIWREWTKDLTLPDFFQFELNYNNKYMN